MSQEKLYSSLTKEEKKELSKEFFQIKSAFVTRIALIIMAAAVLVMIASVIIIWIAQGAGAANGISIGLGVMGLNLLLFSFLLDARYREWLKSEKNIVKKQI